MAGPPQVPDRRSSLDSHIPQQKKRLSLSTMPILSKLGLGKTTSPPVSPTRHIPDALSPTMFAPPPVPEATNPVLDADLVQEPLSEEPDDFDANSNDAFTKRSDILATEPTTHGGRNGSLHLSIPDGALLSLSTPPRSKPSPNESTGSTTELGVLREVDENEDVKGRLEFIKSTQTITKPTSCPKSVWLCSKPPLSPPTSPTDTSMARRKFGGRPLVVRAMSTGRLASEFDDQGRVMCLSNHCERVLKARASLSPAVTPIRDENKLSRSMSTQDQLHTGRPMMRGRTSDLFPLLSTNKEVRKQASWRGEKSRGWKELSA